MTSNGEDGLEEGRSSAPWERPEHFSDNTFTDHADSLVAEPVESGEPGQPGQPGDPAEPGEQHHGRRRRYAEDGDGVSASALIAALSGGTTEIPAIAEPASPIAEGPIAEGPDAEGPDAVGPEHFDRPRRSWRTTGRAVVAALAVMLLLVAGTEWVIMVRADAALAANQISALDPTDPNISSPTVAPTTDAAVTAAVTSAVAEIPRTFQAENILVLGSDDRSKPEDAALGGANSDPGGSDVIMVAHLSADRSHVTIVSIPRDMYIPAPTCKAWDYANDKLSDVDYTSPYSVWRINSTYAAGGPPCTVKAVQELTGMRMDRVIVIDFAGFAATVDALDGIDVNACHPIIDGQLGTVLPKAGLQHIDGKQALNLVRARKVEGDSSSDISRIRRQQKVLSTILKQMTSAGVLLNPVKLDRALQAFVSNVQTDNVTIDNLLDIAQSLGNLDPRRVTFFTLPTVPDSNGVGLQATSGAPLIWAALREGKPLPGEVTEPVQPKPTTSGAPTTPMTTIPQDPITSIVTSVVTTTPSAPQVLSVAPGSVDLQVVNVAGRGRVANDAMDALTPLGFSLRSSDLLRLDGENQTGITVQYSSGNRDAALTVAAAVPGSRLVEKAGLGKRVRLMLGTSFDSAAFEAAVRAVAKGDPVPDALAIAPEPVVSTVTSTVVSTPPPLVVPVTPTTSEPSAPTGSTLNSSDLTSVNAGSAGCI